MTTETAASQQTRARECHQLLLRLSGRAPDDLIAQCRQWLAHGQFGDVARALTFWLVSHDAAVARIDADILHDLLAELDDQSTVSQIRVDDSPIFPFFGFAQQIPTELAGGAGEEPASGGGKAAGRTGPGIRKADQAAVKAAAAEPGAIGMWRAWRFPVDGAPWPPPKRVFVVEVGGGVDESGVALRVQEQLTRAREADPQVEVYQAGYALPLYQELARTYGELLWAAADDPGMRIAPVFDEVQPDIGPSFSAEHPLLPEEEAGKVAEYLYRGELVLVTTSQMDDVVDHTRYNCVPLGFRTDGLWIWTEASAYYADVHLLAPDSALLAHIRSNDYAPPPVDGVGLYRAVQLLRASADDEPVWTLGGPGALASDVATDEAGV